MSTRRCLGASARLIVLGLLLLAALRGQQEQARRGLESVSIPAPWHALRSEALEAARSQARIEALKPALGGEARPVRYGAFRTATWQRALADADLVLVTEDAAPAQFARVFQRSPAFVVPSLEHAGAREVFRMRAGDETVTVEFHGDAVSDADRQALLAAFEEGAAGPRSSERSRFVWLAWIPILLVLGILFRSRAQG